MIDLHSHVLPGIDDGPDDLASSVAMARIAAVTGTRVLAATPHVRDDHPAVRPHEVVDRVRELNAVLGGQGVPLTVVPGGEVAITAAVELDDGALRAVSLGGAGTLLVETPHGPLPSVFEELLADLRRRGFRLLLAHPELSRDFQREPARLGALVADGVLLQLTGSVFGNPPRSKSRELALRCLREGWAHVVASDGHGVQWRPPDLEGALTAARAAAPEAAAELEWMVTEAPAAVLAGASLPPRPARLGSGRRRSWWRRGGRA